MVNTDRQCQDIGPVDPMSQKRLLVTISEDTGFLYGVRFIANFFRSPQAFKYTLLYIAPSKESPKYGPYGTLAGAKATMDEDIQAVYRQKAKEGFAEAKRQLGENCVIEEEVHTRVEYAHGSKVVDIVDQGIRGNFDAIVMGHRVRSWLDEVLEGQGDTGLEIIKEDSRIPLWICEPLNRDARNVLVAVDGSKASYHILAHAGLMVLGEDHTITMFRVRRSTPKGPGNPEEIFSKGFDILERVGLPSYRVKTRVKDDENPAQAILREAQDGGYAVIALGAKGAGGSTLKRFFQGSTAEGVFKGLKGAAMWVCH